MPLTNENLILKSEDSLLTAMINRDLTTVKKLCHHDIVYINEAGETFVGFENLRINDPEIIHFTHILVHERCISNFTNVVVVNTLEERAGNFMGLPFHHMIRMNRVWKLERYWKLMSASASFTEYC